MNEMVPWVVTCKIDLVRPRLMSGKKAILRFEVKCDSEADCRAEARMALNGVGFTVEDVTCEEGSL